MSNFLTDEQKLKHFSKMAKVRPEQYPYQQVVKVFEGAEILIFHYDVTGRAVFDTVLLCTGITVSDRGITINMLDKSTYQIIKMNDIPDRVVDYDIICHVPYRCTIERTVKQLSKTKKLMNSLSTAVVFLERDDISLKSPNTHHAMSLINAERFFTVGELEYGYDRIAATC